MRIERIKERIEKNREITGESEMEEWEGEKKNPAYKGETNTSRKENPFYYLSTEGIFFLNIYSIYIYDKTSFIYI